MIPDAAMGWFASQVALLIGLLPTCQGLGWDFGALADLSPYLTSMGLFVDLPTIATVVALILATEGALFVVRFALFAWRLTPFSG